MDARLKNLGVLLMTTGAALTSFILFGLNHVRSWKDASEYSGYAANLLTHGYYGSGAVFDIFREPGYPLFVAAVYKIFGIENVLAACFIQALLLSLLGFIVYRVFVSFNESKVGIAAALFIAIFPSFGYYANELTSVWSSRSCSASSFSFACKSGTRKTTLRGTGSRSWVL
jgi:hypothetical protein